MKLIKLTNPARQPVYVPVDKIVAFRGINAEGYSTELYLPGDVMFFVKEVPEDIARMIEKAH